MVARKWGQKKILAELKGNESRYYFKFYAFLGDFIEKVESLYNPKEAQKKKEEKKYSQKKSGNSHHQKNRMFSDLDLKKIVQQKARENKENK